MTEQDGKIDSSGHVEPHVTVQATDIGGIVEALDMELVEEQAAEDAEAYPNVLYDVLDTFADIYAGLYWKSLPGSYPDGS